jgi:hypothetical protein
MSATRSCPVCAGSESIPVFELPAAPVTCTSVFDTAAEAKAVPCGRIDLRVCGACGMVFNARFDPEIAVAGALYESSQSASPQHTRFAQSLAADWIERYNLRGKTIADVGCAHGDFLLDLLAAGAGRLIGIDPLVGRIRTIDTTGTPIELLDTTFEECAAALDADALVCRHTLEHIPDINGFLTAIAQWAARETGRVVLMELPASEPFFETGAFWDVLYEHCNYLTATTLSHAFARAGLDVLAVKAAYDGQYLLIEATASRTGARAVDEDLLSAARRTAEAFGERATAAIAQARRNMARLSDQGTFVLWQGAAKTVGLLTSVGVPPSLHSAVDLSPHRHGHFLPGSGLPVVSPDQIAAIAPRNVVLVNPIYRTEVAEALRRLGSPAHLFTMDQLCASDLEWGQDAH